MFDYDDCLFNKCGYNTTNVIIFELQRIMSRTNGRESHPNIRIFRALYYNDPSTKRGNIALSATSGHIFFQPVHVHQHTNPNPNTNPLGNIYTFTFISPHTCLKLGVLVSFLSAVSASIPTSSVYFGI